MELKHVISIHYITYMVTTDEDPSEIIPIMNEKWFITVPIKMADDKVINANVG